jgi:hypothetical protein
MKSWRLFLALAAVFFAFALPARGDGRIVVKVPQADRELLQKDMVRFMEQQHALIDALAARDMKRVETLARSARPPLARIRALASGKPLPLEGRLPQIKGDEALFLRMRKNLPPPFLNMLLGMRETWAKIENDASQGKDAEQALKHMSALQGHCVACHKLYRTEDR